MRSTDESLWEHSEALLALPEMDFGSPAGRVVVLAPHPDDETLALGGALHQFARGRRHVTVVALTDGEASHPHSRTTRPAELARVRVTERRRALERLGLRDSSIVRLGEPDGGVKATDALVARLDEHLVDAAWCLAPLRFDGHPDHDATGEAGARAAERRGVRFAEYPVWAWDLETPSSPRLDWSRARKISLDAGARRAKDDAIHEYRSQIAPLSPDAGDEAILSPAFLAHFRRPFEVLFA